MTEMSFDDAIKIAVGCGKFNGGFACGIERDAFRLGIQTVVSVLKKAKIDGLEDEAIKDLWETGVFLELSDHED